MMYMKLIEKFVDEKNIEAKECTENFKGYYIEVKCNSIISLNENDFSELLNFKCEEDKLRIIIKTIDDDSSINYSEGEDIKDFIEDISIMFEGEGKYLLKIDIIKEIKKEKISVYDLSLFIEYLESLSLESILESFSKYLNKYEKINFNIIYEKDVDLDNSIIYFGNKVDRDVIDVDRSKFINYRSKLCNFINASKYKLSYLDFNYKYDENLNDNLIKLKQIFQKLEYIISLISICDRSEIIENNRIIYSLTGYKTINCEVDYKKLEYNENMSQFTQICDWLYEDEKKLSTKIGIIRNIISISVEDEKFEMIKSNILYSIKSAHEIYLKENVEKYLQVKKEVTSSLFDLMQNVSEIANSIGSKFRNNIIGIVTFFVSIIITNSLSDNHLKNIFTKDITIISIGFIIISIIYIRISIKDTYSEIDRFKTLYERIKNNYDGILDPDDIKNIFHNDKYLYEDEKYIKEKIKYSIKFWIIFMLLISFIVFILGDFKLEYISEPINNLKNELIKYVRWFKSAN